MSTFSKPGTRPWLLGVIGVVIVVGLIGLLLHIGQNLTSEGLVIQERFIRGAPFLAPTLFANMGLLGLLVLLNPVETLKD